MEKKERGGYKRSTRSRRRSRQKGAGLKMNQEGTRNLPRSQSEKMDDIKRTTNLGGKMAAEGGRDTKPYQVGGRHRQHMITT